MARRGVGDERERFWREVVRRQGRSGLSIREFCRRDGLSEAGFYWWRRELERRRVSWPTSRRAAVPPLRKKRSTKRTTKRRPPPAAQFVPVAVIPSPPAAYEMHFPSGVRLLVHASAGERLVDVLSALEWPAC